jgi:uncharacterized caspase-like protein
VEHFLFCFVFCTCVFIGNIPPLAHPVNDAKAVSRALANKCGFEVIRVIDATRDKMVNAVNEFAERIGSYISKGEAVTGFFFFAGHGIEVNGDNFLLPVRMKPIRTREDFRTEALGLDYIVQKLQLAGNNSNVIILDCCREDPTRGTISNKGGLAQPKDMKGTLIAYACAPGSFARDSNNTKNYKHSVYTTHLLRHLDTKDIGLTQVFHKVHAGVMSDTDGAQVPWCTFAMDAEVSLGVTASSATAPLEFAGATFQAHEDGILADDCWGRLEPYKCDYHTLHLERKYCHITTAVCVCVCVWLTWPALLCMYL